MNIEIRDINETRKALVVSLDKSEVDEQYQAVAGEFAKLARIPGFRPGKAPLPLVVKRFGKEMQEEFKGKVVSKAYRAGLEEANVDVLSLINVEEGAIEAGLSAAITFTVDVRPEFRLPDYTGIPTEVEPDEPTDEEVETIIQGMRQERAEFKPVDRASGQGDYVKFGFEGTLDGRPIGEIVPEKPILGKLPQTWEEVGGKEGMLPGLSEHLTGVKSGDKKEVQIAFPPEFQESALAGKTGVYALDIQEVRERVLPELDENFVKEQGAENLDHLKEELRKNLKFRKEYENRASQRRQITETLTSRVEFPIPDSLVDSETQTVLKQFIEDNMRRGVPREEFEKNKNELYDGARKAATARAKSRLILARIAEEEKITVEDKDINRWLVREAGRTSVKPEKLAKELGQDRDRLRSIQQSILFDKTLDFLVDKSTVSVKPAKA